MKNLINMIVCCMVVSSCHEIDRSATNRFADDDKPINEKSIIDNHNAIDSAKVLLTKINEYVKMGIMGEKPNKVVNDSIKPLLDRYKLIYKDLGNDTAEITAFRLEKINELVDLQIKYHPN